MIEPLGRAPDQAYKLLANGPNAVNSPSSGDGEDPYSGFQELWDQASSIAGTENFLHWEAAFPGVWRDWQKIQPQGGFDAIIGNPPWDRIKLQEVEWFASRSPELALAPTAAARRTGIQKLRDQEVPLAAEFDAAKDRANTLAQLIRGSGHYPLLGGGDINLYSLFVERAMPLIKPSGLVGLLTPSGIYADKTAARFFQSVSTSGRVAGLFDFENRRLGTNLTPFFPDVDSRFKFCALIFGGERRRFDETRCAFFLHDTKTIDNPERCFPLAPEDFARVNPNTGTAPVFRTQRDADITRHIYERHPVLVDRSGGEERRVWSVRHHRQFDMTNDSHLFRTAVQLEYEGYYPVKFNRWRKGDKLYLPLYQGLMIGNFDHRAGSVLVNPGNVHNPYVSKRTTGKQHAEPGFLPGVVYWVPAERVSRTFPQLMGWTLVYRRITRPTDVRTTVATIIPWNGVSYTLPMLLPIKDLFSAAAAARLLSTLTSFCFDYVARQKLQGASMSLASLEQLPVIAPTGYDHRFGSTSAHDLVRSHVLRLTYTAHDMAPYARDLGYEGRPFVWDQEERRHLRARLDALYFHLYGLSREDASYILDTFPIVRREDEAQFGSYRTKRMILAYMNALAAGDTETLVAL